MKTMRWIAFALASLVLLAAPAQAAIKYVHPAGGTNWANASNSNQPATLATANSNVSAGDTVLMYGGTYTDPIAGTNRAGTSYANMITFRSFSGVRDSVQINANCGPSASSGNRYSVADSLIRIEHVRFLLEPTGAYYYEKLHRVQFDSCSWNGRAPWFGEEGSFGCKITNTIDTVTTGGLWAGPGHTARCDSPDFDSTYIAGSSPDYGWHVRDTLDNVYVRATMTWRTAGQKLIGFNNTSDLVANGLKVYYRGNDAGAEIGDYKSFFHAYNMQGARFTDCAFDMESYQSGANVIWGFTMRDFSKDNVFLRDTISLVNRAGAPLYFSMGHGGSCYSGDWNNTFDGCLRRRVTTGASAQILGYYDENANHGDHGANTYKNCVVIDSLAGLGSISGLTNSSVRDNISDPAWPRNSRALYKNNTFITWVTSGPALAIHSTTGDTANKFTPTSGGDPERRSFYNNIIYAPNAARSITWDGATGSRGQKLVPHDFYGTRLDTVNNNVYWSGAQTDTAIEWVKLADQQISRTQPGTTGNVWTDTYAFDTNSKNISPKFADSSWTALWSGNVALASGSAALDAGINGGEENIGAWNLDGGETDETPPTVSLTVPDGGESWNEGQGRTITWSASDNVGVTEIRLWYSANGGANWTSIATGEANDGAYLWTVPNVERESNAMRVKIWATDAAGNQAGDSSATSFTVSDTLRPNKVRNLWATQVHWTAVNLRWTGVANCSTTVVKYDTIPLTESGANNFRAHGTSVSTGTPSAAGVLDSATVTGLTPGTRYYFALRHIDNDGVLAETSLVSIGEVRTTRPAVGKGLRSTTTRSYPMLGWRADPLWEEDVTATWPRSEAGWPLYGDSADIVDVDVLRDSARSALYGYTLLRKLAAYGTMRAADIGSSYEPSGWGIPDSVFKVVNPSGESFGAPHSFVASAYKQQGPTTDTTGWAPDNPWVWGEMNNWASRSTDTTGSRRWGNHVYPERLYLWSATQNSGYTPLADDSCFWGSWYNNKSSPCYGQTTNMVYRYNLLSRDTTTGDWDVADHLTDWYVQRLLQRTDYIATPSQHQIDGFWNDYGQLNIDSRFISTKDSVDINRSGLAGVVANYATDFRERWQQAQIEMYAQYAEKAIAARPSDPPYHSGNLGNADIPILSDWGITDFPELDYTGSKGTGGQMGILGNIYGRRFSIAPTIEPSFSVTAYTRRSDHTGLTPFAWSVLDSCNPTAFAKDRGQAARARLGLGYAAMFDDLVPVFERSSETSDQMAEPSWPDSCCQNLDYYMSPFYWDESYVNVANGEAVRLGAYGTGTGRGWLGAPIDDRFRWATTVAGASDTNLISPIQHTDGTFSTLQGWRFSPSLGTASALGRIDTLRVSSGNLGTTDTIIRVSRRGIDHTNFYDLSFRLNTGYAIPIDPSVHHSFRFWAKADTPTYVVPILRNANTGSSAGQLGELMVWVDTTWRQYEVQLGRKPTGAAAAYDSVQPGFYLADTLGTVYFDDLELYNRPIGVMYRRFANGVVFLNPDSGRVTGDSSGTTAWRNRGGQVINYASVFGDTASYDYRLIKAPANSPFQPLNNGRIFGHGTAALDTIPDGTAKFVIRAPNGYWNTFAQGGNFKSGRIPRGRPRGR